jgi:hypothetical protein
MTMQTEMDPQTHLFPKTELDEANVVLNHLITEQDKADKAVESAEQKACEAMFRAGMQRHLIARLAAMGGGQPVDVGAAAIEGDDVKEADFTPFAEIEGDVLEPITDEVAERASAA